MASQVATGLYNRLAEEFAGREQKDNTDELYRKQAFATFQSKGFPSIKEEDWRFTNLVPYLDNTVFGTTLSVETVDLKQIVAQNSIPGVDAYKLVLVNGSIDFSLSVLPDASLVTIQPLKNVAGSDYFKAHIDTRDHVGSTALTALNTAFFVDGYYIEVAKSAVIDKPIHLLQVYVAGDNTFFQPRNMVVVRKFGQAEIIEQSVVVKGDSVLVTNSLSDFILEENAYLKHYNIQNNHKNERWLNGVHISQEKDSRYDNFTVSLPGADLIRNNLEISLNGSATETFLYGLYLVANRQLTDNHTAIHHIHPNCNSSELYKGVIMENGKAVFNGKVYVDRIAQKTNAYQQNNNLLLSDKATLHAKPQLEIFADDVKCSHGCTMGQFDNESLFYLRSRGIGEAAAKNLLVEAFAFDVTDKIENQGIKEYIQGLIYEKLGAMN